MSYVWIFLGGGLGSIARFAAGNWATRSLSEAFPWGTLLVNVSGSFVIGCAAALTESDSRLLPPSVIRPFVMVGLCGGYTTFSAFSLQTLHLIKDGEWIKAGANAALSVGLCLLSVGLGHTLALHFLSSRRL